MRAFAYRRSLSNSLAERRSVRFVACAFTKVYCRWSHIFPDTLATSGDDILVQGNR